MESGQLSNWNRPMPEVLNESDKAYGTVDQVGSVINTGEAMSMLQFEHWTIQPSYQPNISHHATEHTAWLQHDKLFNPTSPPLSNYFPDRSRQTRNTWERVICHTQMKVCRTITACADCYQEMTKKIPVDVICYVALRDDPTGADFMISKVKDLSLCPEHEYLKAVLQLNCSGTQADQIVPPKPGDESGLAQVAHHASGRAVSLFDQQRASSCQSMPDDDIPFDQYPPSFRYSAGPTTSLFSNKPLLEQGGTERQLKSRFSPPRERANSTKLTDSRCKTIGDSDHVATDIGETFDACTFDFDTDFIPVKQLENGELVLQSQTNPQPLVHVSLPQSTTIKAIRKISNPSSYKTENERGKRSGSPSKVLVDVSVFAIEDLQAYSDAVDNQKSNKRKASVLADCSTNKMMFDFKGKSRRKVFAPVQRLGSNGKVPEDPDATLPRRSARIAARQATCLPASLLER